MIDSLKLKFNLNNVLFFTVRPFMLALYIFLIILYFVPNYFQRYNCNISEIKPLNENNYLYYQDLNGDSISEKIIQLYNSGANTPAISYYYNDDIIINQWNLRGNWLLNPKLFFGDYNHNGFSEVYCITRVGDSLFLNAKELLLDNGLEIKDKFICKSKMFHVDKVDVIITDANTMDIDGDDKNEFVFSFSSGFSQQPRNTFAYNIEKNTFIKSPLSASSFIIKTEYMDLNDDGVIEITGQISAVDNIHYEMPYSDSSSWLMVLNPADSLNFLFPPIEFKGVFGGIFPSFYNLNGKKYIINLFGCISMGNETNGRLIQIFDSKGDLIKEKLLSDDKFFNLAPVNPRNGKNRNVFLMDAEGNIFVTDTSLNIKPFSKQDFDGLIVRNNNSVLLDVDNDGENEMLFVAAVPFPDKLVIYRSSLKESTVADLPESKLAMNWHVTLRRTAGMQPIIVLQAESVVYYLKYEKSTYYFLKYPAYLGLYFFLFIIFWLLQKGQNKLAQQKFETERHLIRQQLTISKNQLEPHFMLNTLNNIGYMFANENKEDAQYYFGKFSSLIHRGLEYADQVETSLDEELKFVRDYLILQKKRMNDDLDFTIEADEAIDLKSIRIPHSLVFTFVENAIKHGLWIKPKDRKLEIGIRQDSKQITIFISDNGIGRKQSHNLKTAGTGKGLKIVANIVEGYNKLSKRSISYVFKDLVDEDGNSAGTEVRIVV